MIYVTGSLAFDYIMDFPGRFADQIVPEKIHLINISFLVNDLKLSFGGTAGNIAYNLALLGQRVAIVGSGGKDFSPYKKFLTKNKVETKYIRIVKRVVTGRSHIITDLSDNQIQAFYPGALNFDKTLSLPENILSGDFVVISPTDPLAMDNFIDICVKKKIPFLFDFGMQLPRLSTATLQKGVNYAQIIIANDYEMALLQKKLKINKLKMKGKNQIIVTTLGEKGCLIETNDKKIAVPPAKPEKIIDPTGAGDAFRSGFLAGFFNKLPLEICGKMGNLTAVYTVEKYGTTTHKFSLTEFKKRYFKNYKGILDI